MLHAERSYRLTPATPEAIRARSRGAITRNPIASDLRGRDGGLRPEKGGLHCEQLFGPNDAPDPLAFAHIDLGLPQRHPWLDAELHALPVLPAAYRRPIPMGDRIRMHDLTTLYGLIYHQSSRVRRLLELEAPTEIIEHERASIARDLAALFDNRFLAEPLVTSQKVRLGSLADQLGTSDLVELEATLFALCFVLEA